MEWLPYEEENVQLLPGITDGARALWTVTTPLIHNNVVEWHLPYRVVRQFGAVQNIPCYFDTDARLHKKREVNVSEFINYWFSGPDRVQYLTPSASPPECGDGYMEWYNSITRRLIGNPGEPKRQNKGAKPAAGVMKRMVRVAFN